ncbi:MAG: inorganic phosphate transporter [Schwartzia sp.]|jgi:PiT family inorganic phosphate transporter|uniref:inorganic phosphate transporter n=1 Tax=Schwartzia succinivorans TaxID=55507 RepID=UPI00235351CD|nr:inorganic phosphate transporter [Schwartzia succinivorans]MBE6096218.1 inorganic phosphate transporter [Schwartzia succinivorans]MCR5447048.1 inorganic phosphate transporter [Schwartzia sp. (in: firmicutes)]
MPELHWMIFTVIGLALLFDFINGFHDTANAIATSVSTRAIAPQDAIFMAAGLNFLGAMYSTGVAKTIGSDIVSSADQVDERVLIAALAGAVIWNVLTWWLALPSSSSHALVGGVIGAVLVSTGMGGLNFIGIGKIVLSLIVSPVIAIVSGCGIMYLLYMIFGQSSPHIINGRFKKMQLVSAAMMAFSHGSNDAQKSMGIITLALVSGNYISSFEVPFIVKMLCAIAMAVGTAMGGWRIIKTIGGKIFKLEPISGFAADLNSSIVIFTATLLHLPVSTTHVVSGSIMGVGTAKRIRAVRWGVAQQMLAAWVLTIPCTALLGSVLYQVVLWIFGT